MDWIAFFRGFFVVAENWPWQREQIQTVAALILEVRGLCWENESVTKTVHSALARIFCDHVRALREAAGMTQRDLAAALGREHGMVARVELGERRVDTVEVYQLFKALGANPATEASALMRKFDKAVEAQQLT